MRSWKQQRRWRILIGMITACMALVVCEGVVRVLYGSEDEGDNRFLFFDSETFSHDSNGTVHYVPNEELRTTAVYYGQIEYDLRFQTNNLGFVDHEDYPLATASSDGQSSVRRIGLFGDSFTAGFHGGEPWIPKLRETLRSETKETALYSAGVSGIGVGHLKSLLTDFNQQVPLDEIVLLLISDDFYRPVWHPVTRDQRIHLQVDDESGNLVMDMLLARIVSSTASPEMILNEAVQEMRVKRGSLVKRTLKSSRLLVKTSRAVKAAIRDLPDHQDGLDTIKNLAAAFPGKSFKVLQLVERREIDRQKHLIDLREGLEAIGVEYHSAFASNLEWTNEDFLPNDAHPNAQGYAKIATFVRQSLQL